MELAQNQNLVCAYISLYASIFAEVSEGNGFTLKCFRKHLIKGGEIWDYKAWKTQLKGPANNEWEFRGS